MSASETGSASESTPLLPDEYEGLIERVRETANAMIPRNATVLVVSRGDEELLRIGPRRALHFPQDEFGATPATTRRTATLRSRSSRACARGGGVPAAAQHGVLVARLLRGAPRPPRAQLPPIVSADDCIVFELGSTGVQTTAADADIKGMSVATSSRQLAGPLDELLKALLPADARIAVIARETSELPTSGTAMPFPLLTEPPACARCSWRRMPETPSSW